MNTANEWLITPLPSERAIITALTNSKAQHLNTLQRAFTSEEWAGNYCWAKWPRGGTVLTSPIDLFTQVECNYISTHKHMQIWTHKHTQCWWRPNFFLQTSAKHWHQTHPNKFALSHHGAPRGCQGLLASSCAECEFLFTVRAHIWIPTFVDKRMCGYTWGQEGRGSGGCCRHSVLLWAAPASST